MTNFDQDRQQDRPVGDVPYDLDDERMVDEDAAQALDGPQMDPDDREVPLPDEDEALAADELGVDEDGL